MIDGPDAIEPIAESHDATVILGDEWLMFRDALTNRALTRIRAYISSLTPCSTSAEAPAEADRPPDLESMEPGRHIREGTDNLGGPPADAAGYVVDDLSVDVQHERVTREGREIPLAKLSFDLLMMLIRHAPDLVSVESIMQEVWPGLVVGPETVSQRIKLIREALEDNSKQPRYIAGVRGRGYRLVAQVEPRRAEPSRPSAPLEQEAAPQPHADVLPNADGGRRPKAGMLRAFGVATGGALVLALGYLVWTRTVSTMPERMPIQVDASVAVGAPTIAVLPFVDMSPNHDQGYFSDGLSEELSDRLSHVPGLRVIGRTSASAFKGKNEDLRTIGRALGVRHLLEGSVRKAGDQLRITAQLVDSNGTHVWSRTYDRRLGDVFAIQDEVAKSVTAALSVTLNAGDISVAQGGTHNLEAYDAYLSSRALISSGVEDDVRHGLEEGERAVLLDPGFALAWSWLALNYQGQTLLPERNGAEWSAKALRATASALQLAPDLPSVLAAAAQMSMQHRDWIEAERLTQKALARATGSESLGVEPGAFFLNVGRPREAAEHFRRAKVAEPVLAGYAAILAVTYEMSGDLDQAATELTRSVPAVIDRGFIEANLLMLAMARRDRAQIEKIVSGFPADDVIDHAMQARLDDPRAALAELRRLSEDPAWKFIVWQSVLAYWAAYFGDPAFSLRLLHNVSADPSLTFMLWRPILRDMRRLPAFKDLVRDLGLVTYWQASGKWGDFCRPLGKDDFECT